MRKKSAYVMLFEATPGYWNTVLNFREPAMNDLAEYGRAFHEAGNRLAKIVLNSARKDPDACPVVFLYRHALEILLKAVVIAGQPILRLARNPVSLSTPRQVFKNHTLTRLLPDVRSIFEEVGWSWNKSIKGIRSWDEFCDLIKQMESVDPCSFAFRFPVNKSGGSSLPLRHFTFDLRKFVKRMNPVLESLCGAALGLEDIFDTRIREEREACEGAH